MPKRVRAPIQLEDWIILIRVEQFIPAQLNVVTQQRLLDELFEVWMQQKLNQELSQYQGLIQKINRSQDVMSGTVKELK
ncbi:MAG: hypothetical protein SFY66_20325 [Oculatellaceae cyanobacterium bins.114]|nr:hypothetical protein [Oculatellaceae cyanobacterium bins.114]